MSYGGGAIAERFRSDSPLPSITSALPPRSNTDKGGGKMAGKTQNIEVKVDERLAAEITGKAVERWHATTFSNGKRKVYVTFEEVKTLGA